MRFTLKEIILIGMFAALTAVLSQLAVAVPFISPVPITLQLLAVFLAAVILGSKCAFFSQLVYIIIGAFGAPVFANFQGGFHVILGPTGGYLISFPIVAFFMGYIIEHRKQLLRIDIIGSSLLGLLICYALGTTWLAIALKMTAAKAIAAGIAPFLLFDMLKIIIASLLGYQIRIALMKAGLLKISD